MSIICTSSSERGVKVERHEEQGFMLVGLIVAIFFVLVALSVAAPKVAQELRREREVEAVHRGNQYVRAIRLYTKRGTGPYPATIEQLEKTNNIRYLRQRYVDPLTGKADWRLIKVGEAKTTVKGFFGQPLAGLAPGLGANAGSASPGIGGAGTGGAGQTGPGYGSSSPGSSGFGSSAFGASSPGGGGLGSPSSGFGGTSGPPTLGGGSSVGGATSGPPTLGASNSSGSSGSAGSSTQGASTGIGSQSASTFTGGGAPFVGVGVPKEGDSIRVLNEQTTYNTWEFIYDPRIEQLYARGALLGGAPGLGANSGNRSGFGGTPTTPGSGTSGFGTTPGSGFGGTPSSGFGPTPGSGFGSSPGSSSPTSAPPQQPQQ